MVPPGPSDGLNTARRCHGRLVDVLWSTGPPAHPNDQIGVLVSRLRGVLGADHFTRGDAGHALACDWLDIAALDERVVEAAARLTAGAPAAARAAADAALALVRGPLLPEDEGQWVEPMAGERLQDNVNPVGRIFYSAASFICAAHAESEGGHHVLGNQVADRRWRELLAEAGFTRFRRATETPFNRVFEVGP